MQICLFLDVVALLVVYALLFKLLKIISLSSNRSVPVIDTLTVAGYREGLQRRTGFVFRHHLQLNREMFLFALRFHQQRRVGAWRALILAQLDFDHLLEVLVELPHPMWVYQLVGVDAVLASLAHGCAFVVCAAFIVHRADVTESSFDHNAGRQILKMAFPVTQTSKRNLAELTASPQTTQNIIHRRLFIVFVLIIPTTHCRRDVACSE